MAIIKWFCSFPLFTYYKYLESIMRLAKEKNKEANSNITKKKIFSNRPSWCKSSISSLKKKLTFSAGFTSMSSISVVKILKIKTK